MRKKRKVHKLPDFLKKHFWDIDFSSLDTQTHPDYIIERILEFGDIKDLNWMMRNYPIDWIRRTICNTRGLTLKSAIFWAIVLDIPKKQVKCLKRPYLKIRRQFWPY